MKQLVNWLFHYGSNNFKVASDLWAHYEPIAVHVFYPKYGTHEVFRQVAESAADLSVLQSVSPKLS